MWFLKDLSLWYLNKHQKLLKVERETWELFLVPVLQNLNVSQAIYLFATAKYKKIFINNFLRNKVFMIARYKLWINYY